MRQQLLDLALEGLDEVRLPAGVVAGERDASFYMYEPMESTWSRVYDGVFFIDVQKPATALSK